MRAGQPAGPNDYTVCHQFPEHALYYLLPLELRRLMWQALGENYMTDEKLLRSFEDMTLPLTEWTHRAHVKVALTYLRRYPFGEALARMRAGVKAFNALHGVPEGPTSGYNETTTHAFMHLVLATLCAYGGTHPAPDADAFCDAHPQLMTKHALRLFYSPQRRMHPLAKSQFISPDLAPLPRILDATAPPAHSTWGTSRPCDPEGQLK